ncbi:MAG: hypothetical protein AABX11_02075 [Nanoarchaeota archaeon]
MISLQEIAGLFLRELENYAVDNTLAVTELAQLGMQSDIDNESDIRFEVMPETESPVYAVRFVRRGVVPLAVKLEPELKRSSLELAVHQTIIEGYRVFGIDNSENIYQRKVFPLEDLRECERELQTIRDIVFPSYN